MLPRSSALRSYFCAVATLASLVAARRGPDGHARNPVNAGLSKQLFEAFVYRNAIAVGQPVRFIRHADDGDEFAQHISRHAEPLCRRAVRGRAILAAVADADREVDEFLGQRIERAGRHDLLEALPGA